MTLAIGCLHDGGETNGNNAARCGTLGQCFGMKSPSGPR